ncbi:MAG: hypothetical protein WDO70_09760 [Alphaproteobacteria bacterium]
MPLADWASLAVFGALVLLVAATFGNYGNGFDAALEDTYGRQIISWYASLGADTSALHYRDLFYYGGLFDTLAALATMVSPFDRWATCHLMGGIFGLIGLAGAWKLGRHLGGPLAGFFSLAALALMPSYYGMMFVNPKDIPFAAMTIWAVYACTLLMENLPKPPMKLILAFGLAAGLSLAVRVGGILLFFYLGAALLLYWMTDKTGRAESMLDRWRQAGISSLRIVVPAVALAWIVMMAFWPWAQVDPLRHPFEALLHFSNTHSNINTLFFGHEVGLTYHPALYLPVYVAAKMPQIVIAALAAGTALGAMALWKNGIRQFPLRLAPVTLAAFFPLAYAVIARPELYDADRHFIFILPPMAVLAGLAASRLAVMPQRRWASAAVAIMLIAGGGRQMQVLIDMHPYEYAAFNDIVGGVKGAEGLFETEYWGTSMAEATTDLRRYIAEHQLNRPEPWRVAICGDYNQMGDQPHPELQPTADWRHVDFFIAATRYGCDEKLPGRIIAEVGRDGVPFAVVKDVRFAKHVDNLGNGDTLSRP